MAVELAAQPFASSTACAPIPAIPTSEAPVDLAGTRFLHSVGWALLAVVWGAWLGAMVEAAVKANTESFIGALIGAAALAMSGLALAFHGAAKQGVQEALGRALMEAIGLSWQGAWLGALVGGGLTATNGGAWVIPAALAAVVVGGLIGFVAGRRLFGNDFAKILNGAVWGGVLAGFTASFLWTPAASWNLSAPVPENAAPLFGPNTDWAWRTAGAAPLMLAALVWWLKWMREEQSKEKEQAVGWGMGAAALLFVAAMAAGAGAMVGGFMQWGCLYLMTHVTLPPTPGTWIGALVALFFWGSSQQPKR
jgi:hypothetical protein